MFTGLKGLTEGQSNIFLIPCTTLLREHCMCGLVRRLWDRRHTRQVSKGGYSLRSDYGEGLLMWGMALLNKPN